MKTLIALFLLLASTQVLADDLRVVRPTSILDFSGCTTSRFTFDDRRGQVWMYCPNAPVISKNPLGPRKPRNTVAWDYYVSDAWNVHMGERCTATFHFQGAYGVRTTELECPQ